MIRYFIDTTKANVLSRDTFGDKNFEVNYAANLSNSNMDCISFYKGDDLNFISESAIGILIVKEDFKDKLKDVKCGCIIFSDNPMKDFAEIINARVSNDFTDKKLKSSGSNNISNFACVEKGVTIGENNIIFPNAVVYKGSEIGNNCTVQSNTVIGGVGMSYAEENGRYYKLNHLGNVIIQDNVDVGCNTTVLRGILESTVIGEGSKVGNQCNVGHNCQIGKNCYISAGVMIGGATIVGDNSWIAPGVSIRDHITIGQNCTIGVGSVVVKDTEPNSIYYGNPAKFLRFK
tara:strand:- start:1612 stop:2478 length:867 start_codon:yes stop_codon:yes gene_type:complete